MPLRICRFTGVSDASKIVYGGAICQEPRGKLSLFIYYSKKQPDAASS